LNNSPNGHSLKVILAIARDTQCFQMVSLGCRGQPIDAGRHHVNGIIRVAVAGGRAA
jgi:hypothetical protein